MIIRTIPSTWIIEEEHRLDCGPFVKGSVEARKKIERMLCRKDKLVELTKGGIEGMYHVGQDKIVWADDTIHGMPFLRSSDILKTDLSNQPCISRKQVANNHLFQCPPGSTLITRSGTIGRMAFMRTDMVDTAISQDVLKIIPDEQKIRQGYLYAFLTSKFGVPLITGGTFGSIIVHIEAENIASLPVPRFSNEYEKSIHDKVQKAAENRVLATELIKNAIQLVYTKLKIPVPRAFRGASSPSLTVQPSKSLLVRMDAFYYSELNSFARSIFDKAGVLLGKKKLMDTAQVFIPTIFKRQYADDPKYGYPYFTGKEIYEITPTTDLYLKKDIVEQNNLMLKRGMILVQDSGQVTGLIGRPVHVSSHLNGVACTNNMVRIQAHNADDNGYIFALLSTEYGTRLLKREAAGSSIPHLDAGRIRNLEIPWPEQGIRSQIGAGVWEALDLRDAAINLEYEARTLIEKTIEEVGS
ncbi:restriction endonuclease subunit S [Desulforhopalus sp. IMCC35007]|uniref:methylation-associated defense system restriction endonuclease subunit S MAD5 n=1 Tax=Desulforhopalus sp. IMCC35007 TaxID=2569543 RepID=UPI0010AEE192|nr:restriction endonuclease subunit S [Desulforhopalus sp. IMCC35007]TKB12295.1 hypothetical protein FCL48_01180 [Desulforhopalus sp. IMCC35007]